MIKDFISNIQEKVIAQKEKRDVEILIVFLAILIGIVYVHFAIE